jgi:hypothetical protein
MQQLSLYLVGVLVFTHALSAQDAKQEKSDPAKAEVKKQAEIVGKALIDGDAKKIIDMTYPLVVERLGGREEAIAMTERTMTLLKKEGMTIKELKVMQPKTFGERDGKHFIVVPVHISFNTEIGEFAGPSFMLAISDDGRKTWKFIDGAGLATETDRKGVVPILPEGFELPEFVPPKLIDK